MDDKFFDVPFLVVIVKITVVAILAVLLWHGAAIKTAVEQLDANQRAISQTQQELAQAMKEWHQP